MPEVTTLIESLGVLPENLRDEVVAKLQELEVMKEGFTIRVADLEKEIKELRQTLQSIQEYNDY